LFAIVLAASTFFPLDCNAHPSPNSLIFLDVSRSQVHMEVQIPLPELALVLGDEIQKDPDQMADRYAAELLTYMSAHIHASGSNNIPWNIEIKSMRMDKGTYVDSGIPYWELIVLVVLTPGTEGSTRNFILKYDAVMHQVVNHVAIVSVRSDWEGGVLAEDSVKMVTAIGWNVDEHAARPLEVELGNGSWWIGFKSMVAYGMQHIREGLDHILFLLTLLLVAPLTIINKKWSAYQGFRYTLLRFLKVSLMFTLGHSLTLLIGTFNLVTFRVQYIEVLIALTILVSAINCIKPVFHQKETILAGLFGLVHGLAFSISLSHLPIDTSGKLISVLGFNLGIEAMQLIIMACFFPLLLMSKWKFYPALRIVFAAVVIVASVGWMAERITNNENTITNFIARFGFA